MSGEISKHDLYNRQDYSSNMGLETNLALKKKKKKKEEKKMTQYCSWPKLRMYRETECLPNSPSPSTQMQFQS